MNNFIGSIGGKKFIVALLSLIAVVVTAKTGIEVNPDTLNKVIEAIGMIAGGFGVGQGIADGFSGGKTSSVAAHVEAAKVDAAKDAG